MTFEKAVEIGILNDNIAKKIYIGSRKYNKGIEIEHLSKERQKVWLDLFEEDGRMWSYLFETMLLSGIRPEEACSLKFKSIDINKDMIYIREAYKDVIVYDNELNKKMHKRILGDLKTKQSYRDIPLNPRLKKLIIRIKEDRILYYKKIGKKLNEDEFIFLNQKGEPYVSEMLTNKMPAFIKKYNLEHMTVYRTST